MADDLQPSAVEGVLKRPFAEQVAFFRRKLGARVPTARWDDISRDAHDSAFMVAGAAKADLLSDLAAAVDRSVAEGRGLEAFRKDFRAIVERRGWRGWTGQGTRAGEAWRTRVIYRTNAAVSYAAGREAQLAEGGFPFIVYRHGGSEHPRLEHQSWDGLVLPSDHPFWSTHSPPNGWGCSCFKLGARTRKAARRLGGKPNKKLPRNWNAREPKTGTPPGVGKGWDYAPGAGVAHIVQQMAAKTVAWEYELAKAYMLSLPAAQRDALSTSMRGLPSLADDARRFARAAISDRPTATYRTLGMLTREQARRIDDLTGARSVAGYDFALSRSGVRHAWRSHGEAARETPRGQIALKDADFARLPALLNAPDAVRLDGAEIIIEKRMRGARITAIFEILRKRRTLALRSMRIYGPGRG